MINLLKVVIRKVTLWLIRNFSSSFSVLCPRIFSAGWLKWLLSVDRNYNFTPETEIGFNKIKMMDRTPPSSELRELKAKSNEGVDNQDDKSVEDIMEALDITSSDPELTVIIPAMGHRRFLTKWSTVQRHWNYFRVPKPDKEEASMYVKRRLNEFPQFHDLGLPPDELRQKLGRASRNKDPPGIIRAYSAGPHRPPRVAKSVIPEEYRKKRTSPRTMRQFAIGPQVPSDKDGATEIELPYYAACPPVPDKIPPPPPEWLIKRETNPEIDDNYIIFSLLLK